MEKFSMKSMDNKFDYSILDFDTQNKIIEKENTLVGIRSRYAKDVGKVFVEAQEVLANNGNGTFENWYLSLGFKKQNVHNYMNIYKNVQNLDEPAKEIFENLSKSVQIEMSKPSANTEVNQAVYNGDIKSYKEYKELERKLKEEKQRGDALAEALQDQQSISEVITKEVVKEVKPADYDNLKSDNEQLSKVNQDLQEQLNKLSSKLKFAENKYDLLESTTAEAKQLEATIKQMKGEKNRIQSMFDLADKTREINQFFDKEMAAIRFRPLVDIIQTEQAFNGLKETVSIVEHWAEEMRKMLPSHYIQEAEIVEE